MTVANAVAAGVGRALSPVSALAVSGGGTVDLNGSVQTIASLSGNGVVTNTGGRAATLIVSNLAGATTFSGIIADNSFPNDLSFVQSGGATTILSGPNTYRGTTTVNGGGVVVIRPMWFGVATS